MKVVVAMNTRIYEGSSSVSMRVVVAMNTRIYESSSSYKYAYL